MTDETSQASEIHSLPASKKLQVSISGPQGERLQRIAKLHGMHVSTLAALICNQWLFENYKDHLEKFALEG